MALAKAASVAAANVGGSSGAVVRNLYRCLLRASAPFSHPTHGAVLSSLLHRTGRLERFDPESVFGLGEVAHENNKSGGGIGGGVNVGQTSGSKDVYDNNDDDAAAAADGTIGSEAKGDTRKEDGDALRDTHLPREQARDLTRGYDEMRRLHYLRTRKSGDGVPSEPMALAMIEAIVTKDQYMAAHLNRAVLCGNDGKAAAGRARAALFRGLLQGVMGGGSAEMRFPSQIGLGMGGESGATAPSVVDVVKREFRAPSLRGGVGDKYSFATNGKGSGAARGEGHDRSLSLSSKYPDMIRMEVAFLALRELHKKLSYAEKLDASYFGGGSKGTHAGERTSAAAVARRARNRRQAARGFELLPTSPASSYLRPGAYLVAHPLMPGYFSKTVIVLLDHTPSSAEGKQGQEEDETEGGRNADDNEDGDDNDSDDGRPGGTYGLIVNRESLVDLPGPDGRVLSSSSSSSRKFRPRALREVLRHDCMPSALMEAFGDCPVREGGPVNAAVQMLHTASPDVEKRLGIGGNVLPMVRVPEDKVKRQRRPESGGIDTDAAVHFRGDVIKAAQAVIDGEMDRDDFSFVVGASCWSPGQLESEVERGFWLPCRGPPLIALTGMCDHILEEEEKVEGKDDNDDENNTSEKEKEDNGENTFSSNKGCQRQSKSTKLGIPSSATRPKPDLWLSVMCALGEEEADLAHVVLNDDNDDEYDENKYACDSGL